MRRLIRTAMLVSVAVLIPVAVAAATPPGSDTKVTVGSPAAPFSQSKQNEPAVAVNPIAPNIVAAGANEEVDDEACNAGDPTTCPFTTGVGTSGVYFSDNSGSSWMQPTYTGWSARDCLGPAPCSPHVGPIGTLPRYFESGLVSDGDPAVGFGPQPDANGHFSWSNGWRLYYANITSNFNGERTEGNFKGFEASAVSRLDSQNYAAAKAGDNNAWMAPVIVTRQNAALFSDHEMVAADDASSSPFFGNVYVCNAAFRSQQANGPEPIVLNSSSDGGNTWHATQLSQAVNNGQIGGRQDCAVNTDSQGNVYVFWDGADGNTGAQAIFMARSSDGGIHFQRPASVVTHIVSTGLQDPESGDFTFDGVAGARDGSFPTFDIANGAPTGAGASDEIVLAWSQGPTPSDTSGGPNEQVQILDSTNRGNNWHSGGVGSPAGDRPDFPAIAISPNGHDAYLTYMNFLQPWQSTTATPRPFQGVVRHADVAANGSIGPWSDLNRAPIADARGSSANALDGEFLGDYDYAFATNAFGVAVWNDARNAADCPAIDAYRQSLVNGAPIARPAPQQDCPANFGNSDIYGGSYADPTP